MFKAIPRAHIDLKHPEVISTLFTLLGRNRSFDDTTVSHFEQRFAEYIGVSQAAAFPSCRSGIYHTLNALDTQNGDEVILPAYGFWIDAAMVLLAGLKPIFVDVDFSTSNMDVSKIEAAVTPKTRCLFPTHLNGLPSDMDQLMSISQNNRFRVIEDCARSCGATYKGRRTGSFDIGIFSFGYGKNFYGFGGGMVASDDGDFMKRLRESKNQFKPIASKQLYRQIIKGIILKYINNPRLYWFTLFPFVYAYHVCRKERYASLFRVNMKPFSHVPDEFSVKLNKVQAKTGLWQLSRIDAMNAKRMRNARILTERLKDLKDIRLPPTPTDREHICVHYAIWTKRKEDLKIFLTQNRIDAQDETAINTTQLFNSHDHYSNAAKLHDHVLFLPTHPNLNRNDMIFIADKVKKFFTRSVLCGL